MRRILGLLAVASAMATTFAVSSGSVAADPQVRMDYECRETSQTNNFPPLAGAQSVAVADTPDPAKVFQPVTWRVTLSNLVLPTPFPLTLHYLEWRIPIPPGVTAVTAAATAPPGSPPNPPRSQTSLRVTPDAVVLRLPLSPSPARRIRATAASQLTYPFREGTNDFGNPVVLPVVRITGVPTPGAGGSTIAWQAPVVNLAVALMGGVSTVTCEPTAGPTTVAGTAVTNGVQTCNGQPITVQVGFNPPTAGNDVIQGTAARDVTSGLGGDDRFCGLAGADVFRGGPGRDRAIGGSGNDDLRGDAGNDHLEGGAGSDRLNGGANRDLCNGGPQVDIAVACEVTPGVP